MRYVGRQWNGSVKKPTKGFFGKLKKKKNKNLVINQEENRFWQAQSLRKRRQPGFTLSLTRLTMWALPLALLTWVGLLVFLPYFRVTSVTYFGLKTITPAEMNSIVRGEYLDKKGYVPHNNYFLLNTAALTKDLETRFSLSSLTIKKVFPASLEIVVEEKISSIIFDNGKEYYLLDQKGNKIRFLAATQPNGDLSFVEPATSTAAQSTSTEFLLNQFMNNSSIQSSHVPDYKKIRIQYGNYPIVCWQPSATTTNYRYTQDVPPQVVETVLNAYSALEPGNLATPHYFSFDTALAGIVVYSNQPWKLFLSATNDIAPQLENAKLILHSNRPTQYIDVRYGDKIYWK